MKQQDKQQDKLQQDLNLDTFETEVSKNAQKNSSQFVQVLENVLPHIGQDDDKVISAQILLALKLEGIIGKEISEDDTQMINAIKDSIMTSKEKKESALLIAERILNKLNLT